MIKIECSDFFQGIKKIKSSTVDLVIADPPYFLSNNGITCKSGRIVSVNKGKWDINRGNKESFYFHYNWMKECQRVLKDTGTLWVSGTYHSIYDCGFALKLLGYHILNEITWFKPNASPSMLNRQFKAAHETLVWAKKNPKYKHTFNYEQIRNDNLFFDEINNGSNQVSSVWCIKTTPKEEKFFGYHPTQKPEVLIYRIITSSTIIGDLVLDPFMGSGTVGACCLKTGRSFIGFEKEKQFYSIAKQRLFQILENNHPHKK